MQTGQIIHTFTAKDGEEIILRVLKWEDIDDLNKLINALLNEGADIWPTEPVTREKQIDWMSKRLADEEKAKSITIIAEVKDHVVAITDPGQSVALERAEQLAQREQIGHRLAGVRIVGQAVDYRARAVLGQLSDGVVVFRANDDHVDILAQDPTEIGHALALPESDIGAQEHRATAELRHTALEADAGPERLFLEQQGHYTPR